MRHAALLVMVLGGCSPSPRELFEYAARTAHDLTGDGVADTLSLTGEGSTPDEVSVRFSVRSGDTQIYEARWPGSAYLYYAPIPDTASDASRFDWIQTQLEDFFRPSAFGRIESSTTANPTMPTDHNDPVELISAQVLGPVLLDSLIAAGLDSAAARSRTWELTYGIDRRLSPEAESIWSEMVGAARVTFTFFSGGEWTRTLAWSAPREQFFVVWECC